ncbi:hypothetical protein [Microbacterium trichothecenolyticum]|uniref:hypothetical protein n=1 Tax=Microbacterium trichothecenolyticum TaxID=69370 RepID=UPI0027D8569D|nr:hypothetical protein [Microbacterium trichothecenolyticum]
MSSRAVPSRRSIVVAAAWGVPVVAVATAVPAAAAASGTVLSFSAAAYQAAACSMISGATVRAESNGTALAGVVVSLHLSAGYAFALGGASATVTTDTDGTAPCGDILVPASGVAGTLTATAATATSAAAALSATPTHRLVSTPSGTTAVTAVPAAAVPVSGEFFLDGQTLFRHGVGAVQTDVVAVGALAESPSKNGSFLLPLRLADGSAVVFDTATTTASPATGTPAGATPVAADLFLSGTTLYRGGVAVASDVAATGQLVEHEQGSGPTGRFHLPFRATDGTPRLYRSPADEVRTAFEFGQPAGPPAGATPVAGDLFAADGSLYRVSWDGSTPYPTGAIASAIQAWGTLTPNPFFSGQRLLPVRTTGGDAAVVFVSTGRTRVVAQVPSGASPIGADLFLSGSTVYQADVGARITDVGQIGQPVPIAAGASRIVVPVSAAAPQC